MATHSILFLMTRDVPSRTFLTFTIKKISKNLEALKRIKLLFLYHNMQLCIKNHNNAIFITQKLKITSLHVVYQNVE